MYATLSTLVARYGEGEVARLSAAPDALDSGPDQARVDLAIGDATSLIESYIRRRFVTPLSPVPPEIEACCCAIVRYKLAQGPDRQPTETMRADYADQLKWLALLAAGNASLSGAPVIAPDSSFAHVQDRPALFQPPRAGGLY